MFAGHNAYRFGQDPWYRDGFVPSVKQLVERIVALLAGVLRLQLRRHQSAGCGVDIGLRAGLRRHQLALAIDVALLEVDVLLRQVGERAERCQVALELGVIAARGVQLGLRRRQRQLIGLGIERHQFIAGLDVLALAHGDADDLAGDVRRDQYFLRADIGVVGADIAPAGHIDTEPDQHRQRRQRHQQDHTQIRALECGDASGYRRAGCRLGRGFRFRSWNDFQDFITHDASTLVCGWD